jgi:hypothetical protein
MSPTADNDHTNTGSPGSGGSVGTMPAVGGTDLPKPPVEPVDAKTPADVPKDASRGDGGRTSSPAEASAKVDEPDDLGGNKPRAKLEARAFEPNDGALGWAPIEADRNRILETLERDRICFVTSASESVIAGALAYLQLDLACGCTPRLGGGVLREISDDTTQTREPREAPTLEGVISELTTGGIRGLGLKPGVLVVQPGPRQGLARNWGCQGSNVERATEALERADAFLVIAAMGLESATDPIVLANCDYIEPIMRKKRGIHLDDETGLDHLRVQAQLLRNLIDELLIRRYGINEPLFANAMESLSENETADTWVRQLRDKFDKDVDGEGDLKRRLEGSQEPWATALFVAARLPGLRLPEFEQSVVRLLADEFVEVPVPPGINGAVSANATGIVVSAADQRTAYSEPKVRRTRLDIEFAARADAYRTDLHLRIDLPRGSHAGATFTHPLRFSDERLGIAINGRLMQEHAGFVFGRIQKSIFVGLPEHDNHDIREAAQTLVGHMISARHTADGSADAEGGAVLARVAFRTLLHAKNGGQSDPNSAGRPAQEIVTEGEFDTALLERRSRFEAEKGQTSALAVARVAAQNCASQVDERSVEAKKSLAAAVDIAEDLLRSDRSLGAVDALILAAIEEGLIYSAAYIVTNLIKIPAGQHYIEYLRDVIELGNSRVTNDVKRFIKNQFKDNDALAPVLAAQLGAWLDNEEIPSGARRGSGAKARTATSRLIAQRRDDPLTGFALPQMQLHVLIWATTQIQPGDYGVVAFSSANPTARDRMMIDAYLRDEMATFDLAANALVNPRLQQAIACIPAHQERNVFNHLADQRLDQLLRLQSVFVGWLSRPVGAITKWDELSRKMFPETLNDGTGANDGFDRIQRRRTGKMAGGTHNTAAHQREKRFDSVIAEVGRVVDAMPSPDVAIIAEMPLDSVMSMLQAHAKIAQLLPAFAALEWYMFLRGPDGSEADETPATPTVPRSEKFIEAIAEHAGRDFLDQVAKAVDIAQWTLDQLTSAVDADEDDLDRTMRRELKSGYRCKKRLVKDFLRELTRARRSVPRRIEMGNR